MRQRIRPRNRVCSLSDVRIIVVVLASLCSLTAGGCFFLPHNPMQADDAAAQKTLDIDTVGDVTVVGNAAPLHVQGVGLVTGLAGTGGPAPSGQLRTVLEKELRVLRIANPKQLLDSPDTAMVVINGFIPAGSREGDLFDVKVALPPGSEVKSLRGGYLQESYLRVYNSKKNLSPDYSGRDRLLAGHKLAKAKGRLVVGLDSGGKEEANLRTGMVWEGGVSFTDRPYYFLLKDERKLARVANAIAQRINNEFQDHPEKRVRLLQMKGIFVLDEVTNQINEKFGRSLLTRQDIAKAVNKELVYVHIPWEYRLNPQRFLLVARMLPLYLPKDKGRDYRRRLEEMLQDPAQTVRAAVRLEALGKGSIPLLKKGLQHKHPLVRFCAAEALAYMGDASGLNELAELAERHRPLRAYCLTALASLDQTGSRVKLTEMLTSGNSEMRYGAFRALQLLSGTDTPFSSARLNKSFSLHRVAPDSPSLVHYTLHGRAEVVLFGKDSYLVPPLQFLAGNEIRFTVTAAEDDRLCTIVRYDMNLGRKTQRQCSLKLEDVLSTLAEMGAEYPDVVELLQRSQDQKRLSCPICLNSIPQPMPITELAKAGRDPSFLKSDTDSAKIANDESANIQEGIRTVSGRDN